MSLAERMAFFGEEAPSAESVNDPDGCRPPIEDGGGEIIARMKLGKSGDEIRVTLRTWRDGTRFVSIRLWRFLDGELVAMRGAGIRIGAHQIETLIAALSKARILIDQDERRRKGQ